MNGSSVLHRNYCIKFIYFEFIFQNMETCSWNVRAKMQMRIVIFVVGFLIWICPGTITAVVHHCPPACACLGNMVDCSRKSLTVIPENMPGLGGDAVS